MSQAIDQPLLGQVLHRRADERNQLSDEEKLEVAVLERPESCGQFENGTLPSVGCAAPPAFTMPRTFPACQRARLPRERESAPTIIARAGRILLPRGAPSDAERP